MIRQSVPLELEKQKANLPMEQQNEKNNSTKVKYPVKRKSKFTNCSSRENNKWKKFMRDNFEKDEKVQFKKRWLKKKENM